jgi:L,D-peptidoglycan transpeptidase YkuD (ErfK/YbiS/YcfS/YnhG family)
LIMTVKRSRPIIIRRAPGHRQRALLAFGHEVRPAAIGRAGIRALKREGDGGTPLGRFPVRQIYYRADRVARPRTQLPARAIRDDDYWCDDPADRNYNRLGKLSSRRSKEGLKRADHLYDLVLVLGYNDRPRIKGKGSAIFIHLARPGFTPTDGCIALSRPDLVRLVAHLHPRSMIVVLA